MSKYSIQRKKINNIIVHDSLIHGKFKAIFEKQLLHVSVVHSIDE